MTTRHRTAAGLLLLSVLCAAPRAAEPPDWSRFRGPNGSGISTATGVPTEFGPAKNLVWRLPLPPGHSSPILFGRSHLPDGVPRRRAGDDRDRSRQRHASSGSAPRRRCKTKVVDKRNNPASPSPAVEAERRLRVLPRLRPDRLRRRRQGALDDAARPVQQHLRHGRVAGDRRRPGRARLRPEPRLVHHGGRQAHRPACSGRSIGPKPRAATRRRSCGAARTATIRSCCPGSFLLTSYDAATGGKLWWVRRPVVRDEVDAGDRRRHDLRQRLRRAGERSRQQGQRAAGRRGVEDGRRRRQRRAVEGRVPEVHRRRSGSTSPISTPTAR